MTPEELLKDLRDIQLPETVTAVDVTNLSVVPFVVFAIALLAVLVIRTVRSRLWLRQARYRLDEIDKALQQQKPQSNPDNAKALLDLAGRIAFYRQVAPLPNAAFLPPNAITAQELQLLQQHLRKIVER